MVPTMRCSAGMNDINTLIRKDDFPRSNSYDPNWVLANQMGPNAL